ncbi:Proteasome subunit beta type-6 [Arthrobotrys musiformis]|uniref:Proteasome subunit beta n=1 Tax=Arthrobotrys musiformis TaxID=47236 RepID=A0AAV9WFE8_9PEZI
MASSFLLPHSQPNVHPTTASQPRQHHWSPYTENGGCILGIAGKDYVIIAGDTRSSEGYSINTRTARKVYDVGSGIILGVVGMSADGEELVRKVARKIDDYKRNHDKHITVAAAAVMLSRILYQKRFFPYYCQPLLGGLDEEGVGAIYSYDYVGSFEREQSRAYGAAASLITPFLDNQINFKNQFVPGTNGEEPRPKADLSKEQVEKIVKDAFTSAVERHIEVGDGLQVVTIVRGAKKEGEEEEEDDRDKTAGGGVISEAMSDLKKD